MFHRGYAVGLCKMVEVAFKDAGVHFVRFCDVFEDLLVVLVDAVWYLYFGESAY